MCKVHLISDVCLQQKSKNIKEKWKQEDGRSSAEQNLIPGLIYMSSIFFTPYYKISPSQYFDVFLTVHHSIDLFHLPTLMHNSLFINNMYVTL